MRIWICWVLLFMMAMMACGAAAEVAPSGWDFVYADGWVYYATPSGNTGNINRQLCRFRPADGAREVIATGGSAFYQLCVMDGWVYAPSADEEGVLRVRTDGSASEVFSTQINTNEVHGEDGKLISIYFDPYDGRCYAWRIDTATGERLNNVDLSFDHQANGYDGQFVIEDGWIYCAATDETLGTEYRNEGLRFMRARQDGSAQEAWFVPESPLRVSMWTLWQGRMYYALVDSKHGKAQLRSVKLDGSDDTLISEEPLLMWFAHDGWAYGSAMEWEAEYEAFYPAYRPTVRMNLSSGALEPVGDFSMYAFSPTGPYLVYADIEDQTWNHPLLMNPDGSGVQPLPQD